MLYQIRLVFWDDQAVEFIAKGFGAPGDTERVIGLLVGTFPVSRIIILQTSFYPRVIPSCLW
jgi:hypothetical protein